MNSYNQQLEQKFSATSTHNHEDNNPLDSHIHDNTEKNN